MRTIIRSAAIAAALLVAAPHVAGAQSTRSLRGNWAFTINVESLGTFPVPLTFRQRGRGVAHVAGGPLPIVYREAGSRFSVAIEVPAEASSTGEAFTIVIRGTKASDDSIMGRAVIITSRRDGANPTGYATFPSSVIGTRQ